MYNGTTSSSPNESVTALDTSPGTTNIGEEEQGLAGGPSSIALSPSMQSALSPSMQSTSTPEEENDTELRTRRASVTSTTSAYLKRKTSQIYDAVTSASQHTGPSRMTPNLLALANAYTDSEIARDIRAEIEQTRVRDEGEGSEARDMVEETVMVRGRKRATWGTQFTILSGRAFKNLYRDPALLAAHYISAIVLARE
jgi:hypothetical protein